MSRYNTRDRAINDKQMYDKLFEKRGVKKITQYRSPTASNTPDEDLAAIECHQIIWRLGMTYEKLAEQFYGDFKQWWVIAGFNRKPTEQHCSPGDVIRIPKDISEALGAIE